MFFYTSASKGRIDNASLLRHENYECVVPPPPPPRSFRVPHIMIVEGMHDTVGAHNLRSGGAGGGGHEHRLKLAIHHMLLYCSVLLTVGDEA